MTFENLCRALSLQFQELTFFSTDFFCFEFVSGEFCNVPVGIPVFDTDEIPTGMPLFSFMLIF